MTPRPGSTRSASSISRGGLAGASLRWVIARRSTGNRRASPRRWRASDTSRERARRPGRPPRPRRQAAGVSIGQSPKPRNSKAVPTPIDAARVPDRARGLRAWRPPTGPFRAWRSRRHDEQVGRPEGPTDLEPWRQFGIESHAVERPVGPELELDPVQAPDLARPHDGGRLADLVGRAEQALRTDLDTVESGRARDLDVTSRRRRHDGRAVQVARRRVVPASSIALPMPTSRG